MINNPKEMFSDFLTNVFPKAKMEIRFKNESLSFLVKIIFAIAGFFNKRFLTDFTTVLGNKIYFPNREFLSDDYRVCSILMHEYIHVIDKKRFCGLFTFSYLFPQVLFLLSFLSLFSIFNLNYLFFLIFIVFLLPLPSFPRKIWEMRGYTATMYMEYCVRGSISEATIQNVIKNMTGWEYYKISWNKNSVKKMIENTIKYIETGEGKKFYNPDLRVFKK